MSSVLHPVPHLPSMSSIFFDGDLRSGIDLAIRDSKFVACFIRDDGDESSKWETEYLGDAQIQSALTDRAIAFRIEAGSAEAAFLAAYYPVQTFPALILIHQGVLALHLRAGQDKAAFKTELMTTLVAPLMNSNTPSTRTEAATSSTLAVDPSASSPTDREQSPIRSPALHNPSSLAPSLQGRTVESTQTDPPNRLQSDVAQEEVDASLGSSSNSQQSVVQRLLQDRRRKLEIDEEKKKLEEDAERKAKADARKKAIQEAPNSAKAKQAVYAQEQRKRNVEAKLERERVLRQIEQDKIERKERNERRKALMKAKAREGIDEDSNTSEMQAKSDDIAQGKLGSENRAQGSKICSLQVRLFDGSTIRSKFTIHHTLADVREWVDKERSDDTPFTFKQILTPLPNRSFLISEEKESLAQLGFVPTATLVMIPIKGYTAAYADSSSGVISRMSAFPLSTVTTGVGMVSGALGTLLGLGQAEPPREDSPAQASPNLQSEQQPSSSESGSHIRTLRGSREDQDENQLYNGNQINVHPRDDDTDKDK